MRRKVTREVNWKRLSFERTVYTVGSTMFIFEKEQEFRFFSLMLEGGEITGRNKGGIRGRPGLGRKF